MESTFEIKIQPDSIAWLIFNRHGEKVNLVSDTVLDELEQAIDSLANRKDIKALIIRSGKEDNFIAGADVKTFTKAFSDPSVAEKIIRKGHHVYNKLAALPFPTIALVHGSCFGGGTELALACTYRLLSDSPKTVIGLPEVNLGIFPGWGGTQRAPRLVGLINGIELICTGKPVKPIKAFKMKLCDALVAAEFREQRALDFAKSVTTPEGRAKVLQRRKQGGLQHLLLEANPIGRYFIFQKAEKDILAKTKGHYPAPIAALNIIKETYGLPLQTGLQKEIQGFVGQLTGKLSSARNLIQVFLNNEALKKAPPQIDGVQPKTIEQTGVIGAGVMGSGIAWLFSNNNHAVRLRDVEWPLVAKGYSSIRSIYDQLVKIKKLKPGEAQIKFEKVSGTTDFTGFKNADLVVEAIVENPDAKKELYRTLEKELRPDTIIATNTSSLPIHELSQGLSHPERFIGMHFFNPVNKMPLVEIVPGKSTNPQTVATAIDFCKKAGKIPLVVGDCPGFLVNRLFGVSANEAMWLFQEGVPMERLEKVVTDFGMPMGPFTLADEVGNDVSYKVVKMFRDSYGERMSYPPIVEQIYEKQWTGKKGGKGFYIYSGKNKTPNPEVQKLVKGKQINITDQEIIDRIFLPTINEAARCLEEQIVSSPGHLDMGVLLGLGFPPFRGGILRYADQIGIDNVVDGLERWEKVYGARYKPCNLLVEMKRNHKTFYPQA